MVVNDAWSYGGTPNARPAVPGADSSRRRIDRQVTKDIPFLYGSGTLEFLEEEEEGSWSTFRGS